jgi:predicted nucleic acid-binding protein
VTNKRFVFDSWALLALLQKEEPAASQVKQLLEDAQNGRVELFISVINLGEVYYRIGRLKGEREAQRTLEDIRRLSLTTLSATDERIFTAAGFKIRHAVSCADAFAAAAAAELNAILVSGDPELEALRGEIHLQKPVRDKS